MPEYVYALHDFLPEHEDEVSFHAGERIEVVEKDDLYGDGWWQGRNLTGKVGLFPVSYTAPAPPATTTVSQNPQSSSASNDEEPSTVDSSSTKTGLQTLAEESESGTPPAPDIVSPVPKQPPATFLNGEGYESDFGHEDDASLHVGSMPDNEVMKATMTDVQKAIEQLGRGVGQEDGDGARSFSFASTREGDTETDTDFDLSDIDGGPDDANGEDWHKNARMRLAAKASRAIAEAEKLEAMLANNESSSSRRAVAPPIEVELSDESEDEGDFTRSSKFQRQHPYILEEDENEEAEAESIPSHGKESSATETETQRSSTVENQVIVPPKDESELPTATAVQQSFPVFSLPPQQPQPEPPVAQPTITVAEERPVSPAKEIYQTPPSPPPVEAVRPSSPTASQEQKRSSAPVIKETAVTNGLPSPSASSHFNNAVNSKHNSIVSSSSAPAMTAPAGPPLYYSLSTTSTLKKTHPSEWTLEEVIDWLKSKGFDQDVRDKFIEQEITGDVLLELDANLLKTEIGIMAFGKRVRIANAIAELRRPPSVEYFDNHASSGHPSPSPLQLQHSNSHSRTQSQSHSHNSYLATINGIPPQGYSQSIQSSLGSPMGLPPNGYYATNQFEPVQEIPVPSHISESGISTMAAATAATVAGLGIGMPSTLAPDSRTRAGHLLPSPSDGALKDTAVKSALLPKADEEDRGHMSDGEIAPTATSMRRRLFGRSQDSTQSFNAANRQSPLPSPSLEAHSEELTKKNSVSSNKKEKTKDKETTGRDSSSISSSRHTRAKRSVDGSKPSDRLSIFGATFSNSLSGKSRKPPPVANGEDHSHDRTNKFSLPRLTGTSMRKSSSHRPTTPSPKEVGLGHDSSAKEQEKEAPKNGNTLRKRTVSAPHHPAGVVSTSPTTATESETVANANGNTGLIKQGQNIWDQIGEPDHTGWMRKKGDRYNTWKLRYFILKGPHLYVLRSNSKTETKIKVYIHIVGYKVTVDENVDPGRYGFRIDHDHDKTHYFSSEEKTTIRDWMKAIMKATIGRDYSKPVVSSCNIPTIPLVVAQAMNPAPRPPSPTARDATQKALRRENPDQLSSRDARVLMGLNSSDGRDERTRLDSFFQEPAPPADPQSPTQKRINAPPRPSREMRRSASQRVSVNVVDETLIKWANTHLPDNLQITDPSGSLCGGLGLLRLAESIKGRPSSPPVPDSAFPTDPNDDKLDGLFRLFDFLLDNDVKMGSVSINDVRQGKRDKILQLLRALKAWEDKRKAIANTIARGSIPTNAGFMLPVVIS